MNVPMGARRELLPGEGEERCDSHLSWPPAPPLPGERSRCLYRAGHPGLHYRSFVAWGDDPAQPKVVLESLYDKSP